MHLEMFSRSFTHETITEKTPPTPAASVSPRDDDDDDGFVAFVEGPQLLLFRSFIASLCTSPSYLPSKRTEKCRESHERGDPTREQKKKCEHPKGKEEKEDDSRTTGRVRNERVTCFACFFATLCFFSLPREEDATEKETSAPSRVRSTPVLRNVCLCNREQKKESRDFSLFS